jgi:hypothetical protein
MSFTDTQLIAVSKVLKLNLDRLRSHVVYRGELVTTEIITDIMTKVTAYNAIAVTGVEFMPTESNKGFKKSIDAMRKDLQDDIRFLLDLGGDSNRLLRS